MNIKRASIAYAFAVTCYYLFDYVYMPWLEYRFSHWVFVPLFFSIIIANFLGVYAYDFFQEDVLFIELGQNWITGVKHDSRLKKFLRTNGWLTFAALSIFPSPIAGYLFYRKKKKEHPMRIILIITLGSIPCTLVWGGILDLLGSIFRKLTWLQIGLFVFGCALLFFAGKSLFRHWKRRNH